MDSAVLLGRAPHQLSSCAAVYGTMAIASESFNGTADGQDCLPSAVPLTGLS